MLASTPVPIGNADSSISRPMSAIRVVLSTMDPGPQGKHRPGNAFEDIGKVLTRRYPRHVDE